MNEFEIIDLGNMTYFLGMKILYSEKGIILHQLKYELELLKRFQLLNCKTAVTPSETNHRLNSNPERDDVDATTFKKLVGSLRYLCNTICDICYVVVMVSRFMSKPKWSLPNNYQNSKDLKIKVNKPLKLMTDNKSVINLVKNSVLHGRSNHIENKYHFLRR
ncbi:uncharacterized mitochondrial protein AtMg00810-like [Lathyrus oleraceus]|uniref:uncharacterized mitochondrial protein AtMg00810-like n=1 Tax=Pisum sativum TaxID=3888 RepID=UPI0021CEC550|nr:uncharacterized mitochondrial protein AtMg00810-like [Pisum sativum]